MSNSGKRKHEAFGISKTTCYRRIAELKAIKDDKNDEHILANEYDDDEGHIQDSGDILNDEFIEEDEDGGDGNADREIEDAGNDNGEEPLEDVIDSDEDMDDIYQGAYPEGHPEEFRQFHYTEDENEPIYDGAPITLLESMLSIFLFTKKHSLTWEATNDLLKLIELHCLTPNKCVGSLYLFKKFFAKIKYASTLRKCCGSWSECACEATMKNESNLCYFMDISILSQLKTMFRKPNFQNMINQNRTQPQNNDEGKVFSLYDGELYKTYSGKYQFLSNNNSMSFTWNTDGIQLFTSSQRTLWPIFLSINELPYELRTLQENTILAGIWIGTKKPVINDFFKPMMFEMRELSKGIKIFSYDANEEVKVQGMILCGTCDLPARCMVLNSVQYNGAYGCLNCKQEGESFKLGPHSHVHVYKYIKDGCEARTHEDTLKLASDAVKLGKPQQGIKGPTILSALVPDIIKTTSIDLMHGVFLGVTKKILSLLTESQYSTQEYSLNKIKPVLDKRLISICPPSFIQRTPRSTEHIKFWKASEYKYFLLYYSMCILHDLMPAQYFQHHGLLVKAIHMLSRVGLSHADINLASTLLTDYVSLFETLYGARHMSANIHQLLHLAEVYKNLGPLFETSCFHYENLNGLLLKTCHGTQSLHTQIAFSASSFLNIPILVKQLRPNSNIKNFCQKMTAKSKQYKLSDRITETMFVVGKLEKKQELPYYVRQSLLAVLDDVYNCEIFQRLKVKSVIFHSENYTRIRKRNTSYVKFRILDGQFCYGKLKCFVKHFPPCNCENGVCRCQINYFAIVETYHLTTPFHTGPINKVEIDHIKNINSGPMGIEAVNIEICEMIPCIKIEIEKNLIFLIEPANAYEAS